METLDPETIKKNRKAAITMAIVAIVFLEVIVFAIIKFVPKADHVLWLVTVIPLYLTAFWIFAIVWRKKRQAIK